MLVRWNYEMTDNDFNTCFNNGVQVKPNNYATAGATYVSAWRHIVDLFRTAGATNVQWVWAPSANLFTGKDGGVDAVSWSLFYPGDAYVDWVANDHYNKTNTVESDATDVEIAHFYSQVSALGKPLMQSETAANGEAPQAMWLSSAQAALEQQYPAFRAFIWWDEGGSDDGGYPLTGAGLAAFTAMGQDPYFQATAP